MNQRIARLTVLARHLLGHPRLPLALALAAVVFMLPALSVGLIGDDLAQRLRQFTPAELPPGIMDTGLVSSDSGKFGTVVWNLFGFTRPEAAAARAREYGVLPWWTPETWKVALWRPFTAFTHWLDYRLFPNTPALMHAQNIAWFALAVFLAATLYRRMGTCPEGGGFQGGLSESGQDGRAGSPLPTAAQAGYEPARRGLRALPVGAGLAGCLFLLDKNTYGPVAYVANRGFIISLVFGLLCLYSHLRWRTSKSSAWMWLSALWLLLSLLANEGGASTLAFLLAYALVLEPGGWRTRLTGLVPAAAVMLGWRAVYVASGFGVRNFTAYIDPGYEPLVFVKNLAPRAIALLGGQLTGLPPEVALVLSPKWQTLLAIFFAGFSLACAVVFVPLLRRDRVTRFWAAAMMLALVPAATVVPLSKNLGFVAVGTFGVIAGFLVHFAARQERAAMAGPVRALAWCVAGGLLLAHIPGALAGRGAMALASPFVPELWRCFSDMEEPLEIGGRDVVSLNDPSTIVLPFDRVYRGKPLPKSARVLVPGITPFEVKRADASTLILKARGTDLFECPNLGPMHVGYALTVCNDLLIGGRTWKKGERVTRGWFVAEVLEVSPRGAPRAVAFHFDRPLESAEMVWLAFNWRRGATATFVLPQIGDSVEIKGPRGWHH